MKYHGWPAPEEGEGHDFECGSVTRPFETPFAGLLRANGGPDPVRRGPVEG